MANTISNDFMKFKESIEPNINTMNNKCGEIKRSLQNLKDANTSSINSIGEYYNSANKATLDSSFSSLGNSLNEIDTSLDANLKTYINDSQSIINNINKLIEINDEIKRQEEIRDKEKEKSEENRDSSVISDASSKIEEKNSEFKKLNSEIENAISKLKASDTSIDVSALTAALGSPFDPTTIDGYLDLNSIRSKLRGGNMELRTFVASNGQRVDYCIYVPDYGQSISGLPINMYMHGSGNGKNGIDRLTTDSIGKLINDGTITPGGIVIMPLAPTGRSYDNKDFRDALAELPLQVANEYNADKSRISLSGHSWGAITSYRLVNEHPDEFSAIIPASGSFEVTSAFKNVKVWAFHGDQDNNTKNTSYASAIKHIQELLDMGVDAELYTLEGKGHNIKFEPFLADYRLSNGKVINPLDWAFEQTTKA